MTKKTFPIEIEEQLHRRLKHAAIDAGTTLHALIVSVLEEHVNLERTDTQKANRHDRTENRAH